VFVNPENGEKDAVQEVPPCQSRYLDLGFGCMRLPPEAGQQAGGKIDEPAATGMIRAAIDGGVTAGYMEIVNVVGLLKERAIDEKTIFYGVENIVSDIPLWKLYGIIKKVSPPFVQFYALPPEKIHGVVTRVVM
jgi:hypothetical protein